MLFAEVFPDWFGSIPKTMYTLFQIMTLEGWSMDVVRPMLKIYPYAWVFFIPFVVMSAFIVLNIVVGIVVNSISEVTTELDSIRQRKKNEKQQITEQIEMMRSLLDSLERNVKDVKREK